jgi:hypothetical protein
MVGWITAAARVAAELASPDVQLAPVGASLIPLPHQLRALARAVSDPRRVRYLLADEVGLGKTIEAGLVLRELKLRGLVRRTLVIAPKGLVPQWISELRTHFGEELQLVTVSARQTWGDGPTPSIWRTPQLAFGHRLEPGRAAARVLAVVRARSQGVYSSRRGARKPRRDLA